MGRAARLVSLLALLLGGCPGGSEPRTGQPAAAEPAAPAPAPTPTPEAPASSADSRGPLLGIAALGTDSASASAARNVEGYRQLRKGRVAEARERLEEALSADPDNATASYNLACVHAREKADSRAATLLIAALRGNFPRFGPRMEEDEDLLHFRGGSEWPRVTKELQALRTAWAAALSEPGVFVLVGAKRALSPDDAPRQADYSRGRLYFFHAPSVRVLPLTRRASAAGFLVNPEAKTLHAIEWRAVEAENDIDPLTYVGAAVTTLDLTTFESSTAPLGGRVTSASLSVREGKVYGEVTRYLPAEARQQRVTLEVSGEGSTGVSGAVPPDSAPLDGKGARSSRVDLLGGAVPRELPGEGPEGCLALPEGRLCRRSAEGSTTFFDLVFRPPTGPEQVVGSKLAVIQMGRGLWGSP